MAVRRATTTGPTPPPFGLRLAIVLVLAAAAGLGTGVLLRSGDTATQIADSPPVAADVDDAPTAVAPRPDPLPSPGSMPREELDLAARIGKHLPPYRGARPASLGEGMGAQDTPVPTLFFETRDSVDDVLLFYAKSIDEAGRIPEHEKLNDGSGWVSIDEPAEGLIYTATAIAQEGRTLVFLTVASGERLLQVMHEVPSELPHPSQAVVTVSVKVPGRRDEWSVAATVPGQTVRELSEFYRSSFTNRGWVVGRLVRPGPSQASLEASKGNRIAQIAMRLVTPGTGRSPVAATEIVARLSDVELPFPEEGKP